MGELNYFTRVVIIAAVVFWAGFSLLALPWLVSMLWPFSYFMDVRNIFVSDGTTHIEPIVVVDKTIHRNVELDTVTEVWLWKSQEWTPFCRRSDRDVPYHVDMEVDFPRTLSNWMYIPPNPPCPPMMPGRYQVSKTYSLIWIFGAQLRHTEWSNQFSIRLGCCRNESRNTTRLPAISGAADQLEEEKE